MPLDRHEVGKDHGPGEGHQDEKPQVPCKGQL